MYQLKISQLKSLFIEKWFQSGMYSWNLSSLKHLVLERFQLYHIVLINVCVLPIVFVEHVFNSEMYSFRFSWKVQCYLFKCQAGFELPTLRICLGACLKQNPETIQLQYVASEFKHRTSEWIGHWSFKCVLKIRGTSGRGVFCCDASLFLDYPPSRICAEEVLKQTMCNATSGPFWHQISSMRCAIVFKTCDQNDQKIHRKQNSKITSTYFWHLYAKFLSCVRIIYKDFTSTSNSHADFWRLNKSIEVKWDWSSKSISIALVSTKTSCSCSVGFLDHTLSPTKKARLRRFLWSWIILHSVNDSISILTIVIRSHPESYTTIL